ncbi:MAG: M13 family metallopeptidase [Saccharofermentans sp.]|nr:M13 family metallopeptidase [Saccharofermentans sp.]
MKRKTITSVMAVFMAGTILSGCTVTTDSMVESVPQETKEEFDPASIKPGDDYYGYINAEKLLNSEVDSMTGSYGTFDTIQNTVDGQVETVIREVVAGDRNTYLPGSNEQLVYDAYHQLYDYTTDSGDYRESVDSYITEDFLDAYDRIQAAKDYDEFFDVIGNISNEYGTDLLIPSRVNTNIYDADHNSLVLSHINMGMGKNFSEISKGTYEANSLQERIHKCLYKVGGSYEESGDRATNVIYLLMALSGNTKYDVDAYENTNSNWASYTNEEIDKIAPNMGSNGVYKMLGMIPEDNKSGEIVIMDMEQFAYLDTQFTADNLQCFKDIAVFTLVEAYSMVLPSSLGGSDLVYTNDNYVMDILNSLFSYQIGELYAAKYLDTKTVEDVTNMTQDIIDEYEILISECEWMEPETKAGIISKLENITLFIGADEPHEIDPADALLIGDNAYETMKNAKSSGRKESISSLNELNDKNGFKNMSPQVVNACYNPSMNCINITLGIMNGTMYSPDASYATNMGGIGMVVGHELSHAFDSNCIDYDSDGNYNPDWICEDDREDYKALEEQFIEYYNTYTVLDVYHVDGEQTLGENLADVSSIECILYIITDNSQRKEVFESYALNWAAITMDSDAMMLLEYDEHSPDRIRVNAVVSLFDCFYEIYDVKEGDNMYVAPENRIHRW